MSEETKIIEEIEEIEDPKPKLSKEELWNKENPGKEGMGKKSTGYEGLYKKSTGHEGM